MSRAFPAKFRGKCVHCGKWYEEGDSIKAVAGGGCACADCTPDNEPRSEVANGTSFYPPRYS